MNYVDIVSCCFVISSNVMDKDFMNYVDIVSGAVSGIIVGVVLFVINLINIRRQTIFEREKLDYQEIQENKVLGEIINKSSANKYIELSTLEYIIKIYNQVDRELCFEIIAANDFPHVTSYNIFFKAIHLVRSGSGLFAVIDVDWIMETDKEIEQQLIDLENSIYTIYNGLYSKKYKKKIYKIIQVLEYVINRPTNTRLFGKFEILEFGIKRFDNENEFISVSSQFDNHTFKDKEEFFKSSKTFMASDEDLPYILFEPRNLSEVSLSSTHMLGKIIEGREIEEGCNYYTFEFTGEKPKFQNLPHVRLRDGKGKPVIVDLESKYIKEWHSLSCIHSRVNSYSEKILFKNIKRKNIYYRILNKIKIKHKFR